MAGDDIVLGIRFVVDGKEVAGEVRGQAAAFERLGAAAKQGNDQGRTAAEQFTAGLKRQADTLGFTRSQTLAYEASQHQLTAAQRESVAQSIRAIDAHEKHQATLLRVTTAARAGALAITAMASGAVKGSVTEAAAAEQAHLKLEAVLRATGHAAGFVKSQLDAEAESLKRRTGFDDDAIRNSMAVMLTFKQITGETFKDAMLMAANLSKLLGQDLQSSVLMLGKALEDPETGLTALRRAGVSFNDAQKETIKGMVEFGNQSDALKLILQIMRQQGIEGVAEAMNTGYVGAMNKAKLAYTDLLKELGNTSLVRVPVIGFFDELAERLERARGLVGGDWIDRIAAMTPLPHGVVRAIAKAERVGMLADPLAPREVTESFESRRLAFREDERQAAVNAALGIETPQSEGWRKANEAQQKEADKLVDAHWKQQQSAAEQAAKTREEFVRGLEKEAATLGMTADQVKLYDAAQKGLSATQMDRSRAALAQAAAYRAEQEALKGNIAAIDQRMGAEAAASAALASFTIAQSETIQQTRFETEIMGLSEREREKAIALRKLEADWIKTSVQLKGEELDTAKKIYEQQKRDIPAAIDARSNERDRLDAIKKNKEEWNSLWSTVEQTGKQVWTILTAGGADMARSVGKAIKASIVDLLYQLTVRKWIINIGASISGSMGASAAANAASGLGGLGGASNLLGLGSSFLGGAQTLADFGNFFGSIGSISEAGTTFGLFDAIGGFAAANPATAALAVAALVLGGKSLFGSKKTSAVGTGYRAEGTASALGGFSGNAIGLTNVGPHLLGDQAGHAAEFNTALAQIYPAFVASARALGLDPSGVAGRAYSIDASGPHGQGFMPTAQNAVAQLLDQMAQDLMPNLQGLAREGETLTQTFARLGVEAQQSALAQISSLMGSAIGLQDATRDLWLSDLSPLTAAQRLAEARGRYTETLGLARGGDVRAMSDLAGIERGYLTEARGYYGGASPQYVAEFQRLQNDTQDLVTDTLTEQSIRFAEMGLTLKDISTNTKDLDTRIAAALQSAIDAWQAAQLAAQQAAADQITNAVTTIPAVVASSNSAGFIDDNEPQPVWSD